MTAKYTDKNNLDSFEEWYASQRRYLKPGDEPEDYERKTKRYVDCLTAKAVVETRSRKPIRTSANPNLLTIDEAAVLAGVSRGTIQRWIAKGWINALSYGRKLVRISRPEFEEYLASRENE